MKSQEKNGEKEKLSFKYLGIIHCIWQEFKKLLILHI